MDLTDLTRVLGILLDNAIEEAEKISGGMVNVQISGKEIILNLKKEIGKN